MRWILLLVSLVAVLVSLLTVIRAPDYVWTWKLAIVAGEYGHWLGLLSLGLVVLAAVGTAGTCRIITLGLCAFALVGFMRPVYMERRIAATINLRLRWISCFTPQL
jgi:hypothetical protein